MSCHWRSLCLISVLILLFALPIIVWVFISTTADSVLYSQMINADATTQADIASQLAIQQFYNGLIASPLVGVLFVGLGGGAYCIRKYVWDENVLVTEDFFHGVKANLLPSALVGVLLTLVITALTSAGLFGGSVAFRVLGWIAVAVIAIFASYCFALNVFYKQNFFGTLFNALVLTVVKIPSNLIILLLSAIPFVPLLFLPSILGTTVVVLLLAVFGFGYVLLNVILHACSVFDKFINKQSYPDLFNKGLDVNE